MKPIPEFPCYSVTRTGKVWSHISNKWLKLNLMSNGYLYVRLTLNDKVHHRYVHRLVLETYVSSCPKEMECRHLDGNRQNNCLSNLKWGTHSENGHDSVRHGTASGLKLRGETKGNSKLTEECVRMIIYMYQTGLFLQREIAEIYNISQTHVGQIVNKKQWKHLWTT